MSDHAPSGDPLSHKLAKLHSAAESVERLAAEYQGVIRPVREALQAVADAPLDDRNRWAGAVSALALRLSENDMADVPASLEAVPRWERQFEEGKPGNAFAGKMFCATLASMIAEGTPSDEFFDALDKHRFITTVDATQEVCAVLCRLLHVHIERTAPRFGASYRAILTEAGTESENLRARLAQCGLTLSSDAVSSTRDWSECSSADPFYHVDIYPHGSSATADEETMQELPRHTRTLAMSNDTHSGDPLKKSKLLQPDPIGDLYVNLDRLARRICDDELRDMTRHVKEVHPALVHNRRTKFRTEFEILAAEIHRYFRECEMPRDKLGKLLSASCQSINEITQGGEANPWNPVYFPGKAVAAARVILSCIENAHVSMVNLLKFANCHGLSVVRVYDCSDNTIPILWEDLIKNSRNLVEELASRYGTPPEESQSLPPSEGEKPHTDPFAELRQFARRVLKGKSRAVLESLCNADGEIAIAELAIRDGVDWDNPQKGFENVQAQLNKKLKSVGWRITRQSNAARFVAIPEKTLKDKGKVRAK